MNTISYERSSLGRWAGVLLQDTYRLGSRMGRGAMGEVYDAGHARLPGSFAVKVLNAELAGSRDAFQRFCREAEIMSSLRHPHIVQIFDFNTTPDGLPYFVMEYLEGSDLEHRLAQLGALDVPSANAVVKAVSSALAAAHGRGIVHRDLKPANIFLQRVEGTGDDFVKVLDFGISKVRSASARLSRGGEIYGTPQFMAPEQALGRPEDIDARTDQFSLAAIAYEMLTGHSAFAGDEATAVLYRVVHENPEPLARYLAWESPELQAVLDRAMAKERAERFPTISEFARAFEAACSDATARRPAMTTRATLPAVGVTPAPLPVETDAAVEGAPLAMAPTAAELTDEPPPVRHQEVFVELPSQGVAAAPAASGAGAFQVASTLALGDAFDADRGEASPALVVDAGRVDTRALVVRRASPVDAEWELSGSVDRVPVNGYRAAALAVVALALGALIYVKGWHRELPQDVAFLRENALALLGRHHPLPQPIAPQVEASALLGGGAGSDPTELSSVAAGTPALAETPAHGVATEAPAAPLATQPAADTQVREPQSEPGGR